MTRQHVFRIMLGMMTLFLIVFTNKLDAKAASQHFRDVTLYNQQINFLYSQGIIKGYSDGTFRPNAPVRRLQAVQMILKQLGVTNYDAPQVTFTDMKQGDYGYDQVAKAVQLGIIKGKKDGSFEPWGYLTRAQMAVIMTKAYQLKVKQPATFKDVSSQFWAGSSISALVSNGIANGYSNNTFHPNQDIQRNHFSVLLANYIYHNETLQMINNLKTVIAAKKNVVMVEAKDSKGDQIQQGSGFFVGKGLILTNYHVLQGATTFDIVTNTGKTYQADGVVKADRNLDLAILKLSTPVDIPNLTLGNGQSVRKGDPVVTIGSPDGLKNTVSKGIISGMRTMTDAKSNQEQLYQLTAPSAQGSSGGPVLNMNGEVIGVNSYGYNPGDVNFAIPIDYAKSWIDSLNNLSFSQIQTVPISELSKPATEGPLTGVISSPTQTIHPPTGQSSAVTESPLMTLKDELHQVVASPTDSTIYGIDNFNNVVEANYITHQQKKIPFNLLMPSSLYLEKQHLYVGLQTFEHYIYWWTKDQTGAVASIDTTDFSLANQFPIKLDPFNIVADDSHVYVVSGSGETSDINSYNPKTGNKVATQNNVSAPSHITITPNKEQILAVNTTGTPTSLTTYKVSNGKIIEHYMAPDTGTGIYGISKTINIVSPDGKYLFSGTGQVFQLTDLKATNLKHVGKLPNRFTSMAFDMAAHVFYTSYGQDLYVYDYNTFKLLNHYHLKNSIQKLFMYNGQLYSFAVQPGPRPYDIVESIGAN